MIKIATFTGEPIEQGSELWKMFRARAEVFYTRLGWAVHVENGLEIDRYDRADDPVYVLAYENGVLTGSLRLLPTTGETMLKNDFSTMFDEPVDFQSPTMWEGTRFCIHPGADNFQNTSRDLFIGMCEVALRSGVQQIVGLYDLRMSRVYRRIGWIPTEVTRTVRPNETLIVGLWDVNDEALAAMQSKMGIDAQRRKIA